MSEKNKSKWKPVWERTEKCGNCEHHNETIYPFRCAIHKHTTSRNFWCDDYEQRFIEVIIVSGDVDGC